MEEMETRSKTEDRRDKNSPETPTRTMARDSGGHNWKIKQEEDNRLKARKIYNERREKLIKEKNIKQEELLRKDQEKVERKIKKKMLEERWLVARRTANYIDENADRWRVEQDKDEKKIPGGLGKNEQE